MAEEEKKAQAETAEPEKPGKEEKEEKKSRKKTILIILLALLLCASLAGLGYLVWQQMNPKVDGGATVSQYDGMSREEIQAELNRQAEESRMTMSVSAQPILKDGKIRVNVVNVEDNKFDQRFTLTQDDEVIAQSDGNIEPGMTVEWADAAEGAHAGEATMTIQAYDKGTDNAHGNASACQVTIVEGSEDSE